MTHDIDDAIRESLPRNADAAPTSIDLARVRVRARAIGRRHTLEAVAAVTPTATTAALP